MQRALFELPEAALRSAAFPSEYAALAAALPRALRFGAMSWSYPGWKGTVYAEESSSKQLVPRYLAQHGLPAYAKHPLLRAVEIDRTYYEPLPAEMFAEFAGQVPDDFEFLVKAHEECVLRRYPAHARYGNKTGQANPRYLDPVYAADVVLAPLAALGSKLGALLFQFPPQAVGRPEAFAEQLHGFLRRLPKGHRCAVELRNPELLTRAYADALADTGALHCHNVWTNMPGVPSQARQIAPRARFPLIVRWLLQPGDTYEAASKRSAPFHAIVEEDRVRRDELARLVTKATQHGVPALVLVDNKAEGCAPESIVRLARAVVRAGSR